ncbi:hypothetical protein PF003_g29729 [Phytophthora fragariae]|nr:hypothetical protein PF003_g29729 [Phytophthora fragariae]
MDMEPIPAVVDVTSKAIHMEVEDIEVQWTLLRVQSVRAQAQ